MTAVGLIAGGMVLQHAMKEPENHGIEFREVSEDDLLTHGITIDKGAVRWDSVNGKGFVTRNVPGTTIVFEKDGDQVVLRWFDGKTEQHTVTIKPNVILGDANEGVQ